MQRTLRIIDEAITQHPACVLAFSGGGDSNVLLDILYTRTAHRPPLVWADSGMEYPDTRFYVQSRAAHYKAQLLIATAPHSPQEQWARYGWPMLGKLAARKWTQRHRAADFRCDVSSCCRKMKIAPARKLTRQIGATMQLTGQRGGQDDTLRGLRALKDGATTYVKADRLTICNPLIGWTDAMIRRYITEAAIPEHPAKARGALTIGCMQCGGGAQFDNSGFRVLRQTQPDKWRQFIVDWRAGEIILALKYDTTRATAREAIRQCGGLAALAEQRPWVFDYLRETPMAGYLR